MKKCNYQFTKGNEKNKILLREQRAVVTKDNLTDELAEVILSLPAFAHNIEVKPGCEGDVLIKKKAQDGVLELPTSILSALKEAEVGVNDLQPSVSESESNLIGEKPMTAKRGRKKKA